MLVLCYQERIIHFKPFAETDKEKTNEYIRLFNNRIIKINKV